MLDYKKKGENRKMMTKSGFFSRFFTPVYSKVCM